MGDRAASDIFIRNVNDLLKERKWSRTTLADKLGVKPPVVTKILTPGTNPKLDTLLALARVLEVPVTKLVVDQSHPLFARILELTDELRENERRASEFRIEMDACDMRLGHLQSSAYREKYISSDMDKEQYRADLDRLRARLGYLHNQLTFIEMRRDLVPTEIKRLETELVTSHSTGIPEEPETPPSSSMRRIIKVLSAQDESELAALADRLESEYPVAAEAGGKKRKQAK